MDIIVFKITNNQIIAINGLDYDKSVLFKYKSKIIKLPNIVSSQLEDVYERYSRMLRNLFFRDNNVNFKFDKNKIEFSNLSDERINLILEFTNETNTHIGSILLFAYKG